MSVVTGHTKPWKIKNSNQWLGLVSKDITDVYTENWSWILTPLGTVHIILNVRSLPVRGWSEGRGWEGEHNWNYLNDEGQKLQTMTSQQTRHRFVPQYCTMKCFVSYREHTSYLVFYLILILLLARNHRNSWINNLKNNLSSYTVIKIFHFFEWTTQTLIWM